MNNSAEKFTEKLKDKILEKFAEDIGMNKKIFVKKMKSGNPSFTVGDVNLISRGLNFNKKEKIDFFYE